MPKNLKDKITTPQAVVTLVSTIIGVGILTLPRTLAKAMGTPDGWIAILLGGLIIIGISYFIIKLNEIFPEKTFYQYSPIIVGKFLGWIFCLFFIFHFISISGFQVRILGELITSFLLEKTPIEVIIISFLGVGTYLVVGGINSIARLFEFYFPIMLVLLILAIGLGFQKFELDNLRPVLGQGIHPLIRGIKSTYTSFIGFEVMLFLTAFMKKPYRANKVVLIGIGICTFFYLSILIIVIGVLTVEEVQTLTWPLGSLSREINVPGGFLENFEIIFILLWILIIYTTFVSNYYFASLGLNQLFKKDINPFIYGLLPVIYIIAMVPNNLNSVFKMGDYIGYIGTIIGGLIPPILLGISLIRRGHHEKK